MNLRAKLDRFQPIKRLKFFNENTFLRKVGISYTISVINCLLYFSFYIQKHKTSHISKQITSFNLYLIQLFSNFGQKFWNLAVII